jgi:hypothetical protein
MAEHEHDQTRLVVHRLTWESFPNEREEDAQVLCVACAEGLGLYVEPVYFEGEWLEGEWIEPAWSLEIERWDEELYPFDPRAKCGDVLYRPAFDFPPSLREVWHRRGGRPRA